MRRKATVGGVLLLALLSAAAMIAAATAGKVAPVPVASTPADERRPVADGGLVAWTVVPSDLSVPVMAFVKRGDSEAVQLPVGTAPIGLFGTTVALSTDHGKRVELYDLVREAVTGDVTLPVDWADARMSSCLVLCGGTAAGTPSLGWSAPARAESWYLPDQGWRAVGRRVEATEDGGISWRVIRPDTGAPVAALVRTDPASGLLAVSGDRGTRTSWTNDEGRHWIVTATVRPPFRGNARFLFWWRGGRLYRVRPWPFPARYRCRLLRERRACGFFDPGGRRLPPILRSEPAIRLQGEAIVGATVIPGGLVAVGSGGSAAAVRWIGPGETARRSVTRLPEADTLTPCRTDPFVAWGTIVVLACPRGQGLKPEQAVGRWHSTDGGRSWLLNGTFFSGGGEESFYDADHGWRPGSGGSGIEATEDGGARWRTLIPASSDFEAPLRTGPRSGVSGHHYDLGSLWTNSGGRFWYHTTKIGGGAVGAGRYLVWEGRSGHDVYRVWPWPVAPSRTYHCGSDDVCTLLTARRVFSDPARTVTGASMIPGGVLLSLRPPASSGSAAAGLLRWLKPGKEPQALLTVLPQPQASNGARLVPCYPAGRGLVNWPLLLISGCAEGNEGGGDHQVLAMWLSQDQGKTWTVVAQ